MGPSTVALQLSHGGARKFKSEKSAYVQRAFWAQLVETAEVGYLIINLIIFKPLNNLHIKSRHRTLQLNVYEFFQ